MFRVRVLLLLIQKFKFVARFPTISYFVFCFLFAALSFTYTFSRLFIGLIKLLSTQSSVVGSLTN